MSFWSRPPPPPGPPPLETHFLELLREVGGGKNDPPFFRVKNHESFCFFFKFEPKKGPDSMGFVWGGVGRALIMQFMHFSAIFGVLAALATLVTMCYPL